MISILLLTHEDFGKAMLKSAELIVGEFKQVVSIGLHRGDDITAFSQHIGETIENMGQEDGVLVFVDLFGASPYNATALASQNTKTTFRCITGLNFPMLIEAITMRKTLDLDALTDNCMETGKASVKELFGELKKL
jgi:mannose PTS system EIIA component